MSSDAERNQEDDGECNMKTLNLIVELVVAVLTSGYNPECTLCNQDGPAAR